MSSARNFGYTIRKCGRNAKMSKFDLEAAYKQMPAPIRELRLQGFCWLNRYFVELDQIFGAISAVANFDQLGHTKVDLAVIFSEIRQELVHRHLDDVPVVAPEKSGECEKFSEVYRMVCAKLNLSLAPDCPELNKAFSVSTKGKVLGVWFDTERLEWSVAQDKCTIIKMDIWDMLDCELAEVEKLHKLMGRLNCVATMCPFLRGFRHCLYTDLSYLVQRNLPLARLSPQSKSDLLVWFNAMGQVELGLPIARQPSGPTLRHKTFTRDAAGCTDSVSKIVGAGAASVGLDSMG